MPTWTPPVPRPGTEGRKVPGALSGTLLFDQPRHRAERDELLAFVGGPGPLTVEVGFDHGMVLLDAARRWPDQRWLGLEIRERRVDALRPIAPANCLPFRGDARTVFAAVLPAASVDACLVLFPDPVWVEAHRARHLLFSPAFVALVARVLRPGGVLHVATDVPEYFAYVAALLSSWRAAPAPERTPTLSRRERVCRRDGVPVHAGTWTPTS